MSLQNDKAKVRGFEHVSPVHRKHKERHISLPQRADKRSAGYDFYAPCDFTVEAEGKIVIFTDVKAYMQNDEFLMIVPRSSVGTKHNLMLANTLGVIDASYYNNEDNDGNIGISFRNLSEQPVTFKVGDRICQGIFLRYLTADNDEVLNEERTGGFGSSGK